MPNVAGTLNSNNAVQAGGSLTAPTGIAVDASGNLYVASSAPSVSKIARTSGYLNLGRYNVATTSPTLTENIESAGNQPLIFGATLYTESGDTTDFTVSNGANACASGASLAAGASCALEATFAPMALPVGDRTDTLTFSANAANSTVPTVVLAGTVTNSFPTTLALAVTSPSGSPILGQPVVITATLTPSNTTSTPTGTVTFVVDGQSQSPVTLVNGTTAAITLGALTGGAHSITASYSGDDNYAASAASAVTVTVLQATSTTTLTLTTPYVNPASAIVGSTVTLTGAVAQVGAIAPTGTVSFYNGTTLVGTAAVQGVTPQQGAATVYEAILQTTNLPAGTYALTAVYGGDVNYSSSTSAGVTIIVAASPSFQLTASATTVTASAETPGVLQITPYSVAGFSGSIVFSCQGLPKFATCSFNPASYPIVSTASGAAANVPLTLQVLVSQTPGTPPPVLSAINSERALLALLCMSPFGWLARRRLRGWMVMLMVAGVSVMVGLSGCDSVNNSYATPKGTYQVTVVATGSTAITAGQATTTTQFTLPFTLTVTE